MKRIKEQLERVMKELMGLMKRLTKGLTEEPADWITEALTELKKKLTKAPAELMKRLIKDPVGSMKKLTMPA